MSGYMSGDGLADRVRDEWYAMGKPSLAELNKAEGIEIGPIKSYFYIEHDTVCAVCPWGIEEGDLVGVLADGSGYVCPGCHEGNEDE